MVCGGLAEKFVFNVDFTDESRETSGGGKASSAGPESGWESGTRSTDAGEEKRGTGGGRGGDWSWEGGAFSLLLFVWEFSS
jgi:hypothetical protein